MSWTPPPNWPPPPSPGWTPPKGWKPDPAWGPAPPGWNFWPVPASPPVAQYGAAPVAGSGLRGWVSDHKGLATVLGALIVLVLIGGIASAVGGGSKSKPKGHAAGTAPVVGSTPDAPAPAPAPTASPDARYTSSCDYVLGDFTENTSHGFRFIGRASMHNTGNIGVVVVVKASWVQVGTHNVVRTKRVRLPRGGRKVVNFTVPVSSNQLDAIQAGQDAGSICHVKSTIVNEFGSPR